MEYIVGSHSTKREYEWEVSSFIRTVGNSTSCSRQNTQGMSQHRQTLSLEQPLSCMFKQ